MSGQAQPKTMTYMDGEWYFGNKTMMGPRTQGVWMSTVVFDGARAFDGVIPDLYLHCARVIQSARFLGMDPMLTAREIEEISREGVDRFDANAALYICPMFYAEEGFISPQPDSTRFTMTIHEAPIPGSDGFTACRSSYRRPARDMAPTEAKASCLYPNVARCVREANRKGYETAVVMDPSGNVAEFAYTNLFYVKNNVIYTPVINGTFLNGITRQRVIALARQHGIMVIEKSIEYEDLMRADEIFSTGNYAKVSGCTKLDEQTFEIGPITKQLRDVYFNWALKNEKTYAAE